ncbi:hypothetical protein NR798_31150 [Archangium gephyra]|uniref:hypothetical protein n=1 Tax=Archangium gephyra TaxID=48 RepID=UPI0035D4D87C
MTFMENMLIPERDGYFPLPTPKNHPELLEDPDRSSWLLTEEILGELKSGQFRRVEHLLEIYRRVESGTLRATIERLLGDAGTRSCFKQMSEELQADKKSAKDEMALYFYRDKAIHYCDAFQAWGLLDAVPVILDHYLTLRLAEIKEIEIFPSLLSFLLENDWGLLSDEPPDDSLEEYLGLVMDRYEELCAQFGSGNVLVYGGERSGVQSFARRLCNGVGREHRDAAKLRRRFEASTGIDCHDFYVKQAFQPLSAARIAENFLNSPQAAKYEEGRRYFFGYPIPD